MHRRKRKSTKGKGKYSRHQCWDCATCTGEEQEQMETFLMALSSLLPFLPSSPSAVHQYICLGGSLQNGGKGREGERRERKADLGPWESRTKFLPLAPSLSFSLTSACLREEKY